MKALAASLTLVVSLFVGVGHAHAVGGFSWPPYSPNSNPSVIQQHACAPVGSNSTCWRWVRKGGTFVQGPAWQLSGEQPLVDIICSYLSPGAIIGGKQYWDWKDVFSPTHPSAPFCRAGSPDFWVRNSVVTP